MINKQTDMKTYKTQYETKSVIDYLKEAFSNLDSAEMQLRLSPFDYFDFDIDYKNDQYLVLTSHKNKANHDKVFFDSKVDAIKHILRTLKIIK